MHRAEALQILSSPYIANYQGIAESMVAFNKALEATASDLAGKEFDSVPTGDAVYSFTMDVAKTRENLDNPVDDNYESAMYGKVEGVIEITFEAAQLSASPNQKAQDSVQNAMGRLQKLIKANKADSVNILAEDAKLRLEAFLKTEEGTKLVAFLLASDPNYNTQFPTGTKNKDSIILEEARRKYPELSYGQLKAVFEGVLGREFESDSVSEAAKEAGVDLNNLMNTLEPSNRSLFFWNTYDKLKGNKLLGKAIEFSRKYGDVLIGDGNATLLKIQKKHFQDKMDSLKSALAALKAKPATTAKEKAIKEGLIKQAEQRIIDAQNQLDSMDAYALMDSAKSRAAYLKQDMYKWMWEGKDSFMNRLARTGMSIEQFNAFMLAHHQPERLQRQLAMADEWIQLSNIKFEQYRLLNEKYLDVKDEEALGIKLTQADKDVIKEWKKVIGSVAKGNKSGIEVLREARDIDIAKHEDTKEAIREQGKHMQKDVDIEMSAFRNLPKKVRDEYENLYQDFKSNVIDRRVDIMEEHGLVLLSRVQP